jgi:hypothetical protein
LHHLQYRGVTGLGRRRPDRGNLEQNIPIH